VIAVNADRLQQASISPTLDGERGIRQLIEAISCGKHWYIALLEAIGLWRADEEIVDGRRLRYFVDGEAFDWLLLAQRLCHSAVDMIPEDEKEALLFHGKPPIRLSPGEFKELIGVFKYHQYLNHFYGITAEEALMQAVEDEVRKERQALGPGREQDISEAAYGRLYGATQEELLADFRSERAYPQSSSIGLDELKEFTYWLFGYRLRHSEKARVASDTKKALRWLRNNTAGNLELVC
jgi:hypothetical protein